jgi:hypothetical protein
VIKPGLWELPCLGCLGGLGALGIYLIFAQCKKYRQDLRSTILQEDKYGFKMISQKRGGFHNHYSLVE